MAEIKVVRRALPERRLAQAIKTASETETVKDLSVADSKADSQGQAALIETAHKARRADFLVRDSADALAFKADPDFRADRDLAPD